MHYSKNEEQPHTAEKYDIFRLQCHKSLEDCNFFAFRVISAAGIAFSSVVFGQLRSLGAEQSPPD